MTRSEGYKNFQESMVDKYNPIFYNAMRLTKMFYVWGTSLKRAHEVLKEDDYNDLVWMMNEDIVHGSSKFEDETQKAGLYIQETGRCGP